MLHALLGLTLLTPAAPGDVVVRVASVEAVGLDEASAARLPARLAEELRLAGLDVAEGDGEERPADAALFLSVVRVGPLVEVAVRVEDRAGVVIASTRRTHRAGAISASTLVSPELGQALRALVEPPAKAEAEVGMEAKAPPPPATTTPAATATPTTTSLATSTATATTATTTEIPATTATGESEERMAPPVEEAGGWLGLALAGSGGTAAVIGLSAAAAGFAGAAYEASVLGDPASAGTAKARARVTGPLALAAAAAGSAVLLGGLAVASSSLAVE